jgi:hypothetical protein
MTTEKQDKLATKQLPPQDEKEAGLLLAMAKLLRFEQETKKRRSKHDNPR